MGFFPLDYEKACQRAAVIANKPYGGSLSGKGLKDAYMAGCYWHTINGSVYFNDKAASAPGSVDSFALQLCAGAPSPAVCGWCSRARTRQGPQGLRSRCVCVKCACI